MLTMLRRMFWLALIGGAGYAGWMVWQNRSTDDSAAAPVWPPLDPPEAASVPVSSDPPGGDTSRATWVEPVDGACPDGFSVKVKVNSGIFHLPGGRFYERTVPDRCYADAAGAEADGYRRSKA